MANRLALCAFITSSVMATGPNISVATNSRASVASQLIDLARLSFARIPLSRATRPTLWDMVALFAACGLFAVCTQVGRRRSGSLMSTKDVESRAAKSDPGLLRKHSSYEAYETSHATYPQIRTFYHRHPQADKLTRTPKPLPLLVFVHGLGGSLAQFNHLLTGLVNIAPCFGIDFPGCGLSDFSPRAWDAYSHAALVELLDVAISRALERAEVQEAVLVCHSMGCSIAASLLNGPGSSDLSSRARIVGVIAICPKVSQPTVEQVRAFQKLLRIPTPLFDLWRAWDRMGGVNSPSVARFMGPNASKESKKLQLRFNEQSKTAIWRRMAWGATPVINDDLSLSGGLPGPDVWSQIAVPLFVVVGQADKVTKAEEATVIATALGRGGVSPTAGPVAHASAAAAPREQAELPQINGSPTIATSEKAPLDQDEMDVPLIEKEHPQFLNASHMSPQVKRAVLKTTVLPSPASHSLLYDHATYRTLSGLIQTFLADYIDERLSLGWQLQHMKDANKWDVKNLAKWQAVRPVSEPIVDVFLAMKTLREADDVHSPVKFVQDWSGKIKAVIDISHDCPVYSPEGLESGGIEYHKFPTVSKVPPTPEECTAFIALVDQLRGEERAAGGSRLIGVHCHYGYNRTGFFICSYLIERERFGVQQAIDEFARQRPDGIRHGHFLDGLFARYCVGLKCTPTL